MRNLLFYFIHELKDSPYLSSH